MWFQAVGPSQDQIPVQPKDGSRFDSASMLQLLHQQRHESQGQGSSYQADRVSVACQTRQGETWQVYSQACKGGAQQESGSWADHGNYLQLWYSHYTVIAYTYSMVYY